MLPSNSTVGPVVLISCSLNMKDDTFKYVPLAKAPESHLQR